MANFLDDNIVEHCLKEFPTIVEPILGCLNARDLSSAACVCSFWYTVSKRIWQKRKHLLTKLLHKPDGEETQSSMIEMAMDLSKFIDNSMVYPCAAILYMSRSDEFFSKSNPKHMQKVIRSVYSALPRNCRLIGGLGGGIIGCNALRSLEVEQCEGLSTLLLPRNPEISVSDFFITISDVNSAGKSVEKWQQLLGCSKSSNVKLVLLNACCEPNGIEATIKMIAKTFGKNVLIAGGLAESNIHGVKMRKKGISGLVFAGNLAASLVVHKNLKSREGMLGQDKEMFIENLERLKSSIGVKGYNVIFMYSCVARGYGLYSENNVQTTWVSEVFSSIPVIGMFAFGEIGYGPLVSEIGKNGFHSYSTILCLCKF